MDTANKWDKQEVPCLDSIGNTIHADMYGDMKYYGNKIFCWICCMIICGPFFIIMGISSLGDAAGTDERMQRIPDYNAAVEAWNKDGRAAFADIKFTLKVEDASKATYPTSVGSAVKTEGGAAPVYSGFCAMNTVATTNFDCGVGFHLKAANMNKATLITVTATTDTAKKTQCCDPDVVGKCAGNTKQRGTAAPLLDLVQNVVDKTWEFPCSDDGSKILKDNRYILPITDAQVGTAAAAVCCDATHPSTSLKCSGNKATSTDMAFKNPSDRSYEFNCGAGYTVNGHTASMTAGTAAVKKASCCTATTYYCKGNGLAASFQIDTFEEAADGTFQFKCGAGYRNKDLNLVNAVATKDLCCEILPVTTGGATPLGNFTAFAPADLVPDSSKREKEVFTATTTTLAYSTALKRVAVKDDTVKGAAKDDFKPQMTKMTLSGAGVSNEYIFQSVMKFSIPEQDAKYNWYIARSSSGQPSSITCKNPKYQDYPGTRFGSKITCPNWCTEKKGGVWTDNGSCYNDRSSSPVATKCCIVAKKDTFYGLKQVSFAADCTDKKCKVASTFNTGGAMNALTSFKATPYTAANFDVEKTNPSYIEKTSYPSLIYAEMATLDEWKADESVNVEIRSVLDPYYMAQNIQTKYGAGNFKNGCASGTSDFPYKMAGELKYTKLAGKDYGPQCFGNTPGQNAANGLLFIVIGAIILCPICFVFCVVRYMGNERAKKDPSRGWKNVNQAPVVTAQPVVVQGSPSGIEMMA